MIDKYLNNSGIRINSIIIVCLFSMLTERDFWLWDPITPHTTILSKQQFVFSNHRYRHTERGWYKRRKIPLVCRFYSCATWKRTGTVARRIFLLQTDIPIRSSWDCLTFDIWTD